MKDQSSTRVKVKHKHGTAGKIISRMGWQASDLHKVY